MEQLSDHPYSRLALPDDPAGNCLFTRPGGLPGGVLVHRGPEEFPQSQKVGVAGGVAKQGGAGRGRALGRSNFRAWPCP